MNDKNNNNVIDMNSYNPNIMSNEEYNRLVKQSISGQKIKAKPKRMTKIAKNKAKKALVTLCCSCMIIGAVAATGIKALSKTIEDVFEINEATVQYKQEAINDNTYRVNNNKDYAYHYDKIAEHVKTDEDVYLLYRNLGESQSNQVLKYVDNIESIDSFIKDHNYENIDEWSKIANKQILLQNEISSKQSELNKMQDEYKASLDQSQNNDLNQQLGGK